MRLTCSLLLFFFLSVSAEWVLSSKDGNGKWKIEGDKITTTEDARFYQISKKVDTPKSGDLVVSFSVRHPQNIDCGGGYLKLLPTFDQATFTGDSSYKIMFGPDICGATKKIHTIFNYKGKNLNWKKEPRAESDTFTHFYTLVVKDDAYEVYVDFVKKESGKLEDDWEFFPSKTIADPSESKPSDWVDEAEINDPEDSKPADWDTEPATIADPDATKPDDWDEEEDGEWEAPTLPNPKFKGEWKPRRIPNPKYKGEWKAKQIANPEYKPEPLDFLKKDIAVVGVDIWQVKSGSVFDNILITNSFDEAKAAFEAEKADLAAEKEEEEKKKAKPAETTGDDDDDDEDDDDDKDENDNKNKHDEL
jgi:calreticulin